MIRSSRRSLGLAAALLSLCATDAALAGQASTSGLRDGGTYDQFIVRFGKGTPEHRDASSRQRVFDTIGRAHGVGIRQLRRLAVGADVVRLDHRLPRAAALALMQRLAKDPSVEFVEVDAKLAPAWTPNDTNYAMFQWNFFQPTGGINLPNAWNRARGAGVVVAVVDTGVTYHSDLQANLLPGYDFIVHTGISGDGDGRDGDPTDVGDWVPAGYCDVGAPATTSTWHGTRVAGLVAAVTDNGKMLAGVAPQAKVVPVRALGKCGGFTSDTADAIYWAAGLQVSNIPLNANPAEVINLSLGGPGGCPAGSSIQLAINAATATGAVVVAAAGNEGADVANSITAGCDNVIAVAATDSFGGLASYSNHGAKVDVSAPGGGPTANGNGNDDHIWSLTNLGFQGATGEGWGSMDGTSFSSPQVAGVVALMQSSQTRTPAEVEYAIKTSARALPGSCPDYCGTGIVNADQAIVAAGTVPALPTLSVANASVSEGNSGTRTATFIVSLSQAAPQPVTFAASTPIGVGSASADLDYATLPATRYTIPAGQLAQAVSVVVNGDTAVEANETFTLQVSQPDGANAGNLAAIGTINNDDVATLSIQDITVAEPAAGQSVTVPIRVALSQALATPVTFSLASSEGTAGMFADAFPVGGSYTIPAGQAYLDIDVEIVGDDFVEADETFSIDVSSVGGATLVDGHAIVTITSDDTTTLTISDASVAEGDQGTTTLEFTVSSSNLNEIPLNYWVSTGPGGSATANVDYIAVPLTQVVLPIQATTQKVTVTVQGDTEIEPNELLAFNLTSYDPDVVLLPDHQGLGTITNDDAVRLSVGDASTSEGNSGTKLLTFTVSLSNAAAAPVTFNLATENASALSGSDYVAATATGLSIPAGQLSKTFTVTINGDATDEANETFKLNATGVSANAQVADSQGIGTILNDDGPTLAVSDATVVEGAAGTTIPATFTVTLSQAQATPVVFSAATQANTAANPADYAPLATTQYTIPAGATTQTFSVTVKGDALVESNESFFVNLSGATAGVSFADGQGVGTITSDDLPTLSISDVTVAEGNSGTTKATFLLTLSDAVSAPVTYNLQTGPGGTATAGTDYAAVPLTAQTIYPGQTQRAFSVLVNGDTEAEVHENFALNLTSVVGANRPDPQGIGTIQNDD